jgi:two-component system sensor histidine kinase VanS
VIGYLTLLKEEPDISKQMREKFTQIAWEKAQRLENLINEFFEIARFNLTTMTLEKEWISLSMLLEQLISEFAPILSEKGLYCETEITPDIRLLCDADKLERVFDNLMRNAVNYSYPDTPIAVKMQPKDGEVIVCISNHGKTIAPEKLSHIFEQFYRLDSSRATATGGAGLGLAIAKEIVELHGGTIFAESRNEQILFTVRLPMER